MNTKFSISLILIVIVIIAAACAPTITDSSGPADPVEPADQSFIMPVTGDPASTGVRSPQEPQQWSGEIFLSEGNSPDVMLQDAVDTGQQTIRECMSEDNQPRRQSGCTE